MDMRETTMYSQFEPDEDKIKKLILFCSEKGFLYLKDGCLMLGRTYTPWFNNDLCASDVLLYTIKESRGKGLATEAIKSFIDWAKNKGAVSISISQSTGTNREEFDKMSENLGLQKIGAVYHV